MIRLESGTLELGNDRWPHLRRVLEAILPHWIEDTKLGGKGIQLFLLDNQDIERKDFGGEFPPIMVLRALREGGPEPKPMPWHVQLQEMGAGVDIDFMMDKLQILDDATRMKPFWNKKKQQDDPASGLGQGDGYFRSYKVVFSTWYYDTFLNIYLSYHYTPA